MVKKFLIKTFKENKQLLVLLFIASLLARIFDTALPFAFKLLIDAANTYQIHHNNAMELWMALGLILTFAIISRLCFRVYDYAELKFMPHFREKTIKSLYEQVVQYDINFFHNNATGSISNKIIQITENTKKLILMFSTEITMSAITLIFSSIFITIQSPKLGILVTTLSLIYAVVSYKLSKKAKHLASEFSAKQSEVHGKIIDSISNISIVKSFSKEKEEKNNINLSLEEEKNINIVLKKVMFNIKMVHVIFSAALISLTMILTVFEFLNAHITVGDMVLIFMYTIRIAGDLHLFGDRITNILESFGLLHTAINTIFHSENKNTSSKENINIINGKIEFQNITFSYNNERQIFHDFNLIIKPKEKIALIGDSGAGKSTLIKLLTKFYIPQGKILIDEQDINNVSQHHLNEKITLIQQDVLLFNRSIKDNIKFVNQNASDEDIILACQKAQCMSFINKMENGLNSIVGENGVKLSGGEKQRIALARAFLLNNPIIILDEPTSALDSESEQLFQESLNELIKDKTTIVIAHRLSTIRHMDRIIVLQNGQIIEEGNHHQLMNNGKAYKDLVEKQTKGFLVE